jgi:porin
MLNVPGRSDQLGIGAWWQDLSHRDLDDQSGMEVFYRWNVIPNLALTPSIQFLNDPALNPDADRIILFGLRARVLFF